MLAMNSLSFWPELRRDLVPPTGLSLCVELCVGAEGGALTVE